MRGITLRKLEQAKKLDPEARHDPDQYLATLQMFEQMAPNYGANWPLKVKEGATPTTMTGLPSSFFRNRVANEVQSYVLQRSY